MAGLLLLLLFEEKAISLRGLLVQQRLDADTAGLGAEMAA
jgi:hypothetical protein